MQEVQKDEYQKIMKEILIYGEPSGNLEECLGFYTKQKLADISQKYDISSITSKKKDVIVSELTERIITTMPENLLYEDIEELTKLLAICKNELNIEEFITITSLLKYRQQGWIYLFTSKGDDKINVVVPDKIKSCINDFLGNKNNVDEASLNQEILKYLKVLNNLYGVYDIEQFVRVWNKYHNEKLEYSQANKYLNNLKDQFDFFWKDGKYIIDEVFGSKEEYECLLEETQNKPYYIPTEEDINIYEEELVDIDSKYYQDIKAFLGKKVKDEVDLDNLLFEMETVCVLEALPEDVINLMKEYEVIFSDTIEVKRFTQLYIDWHNHTRVWTNRGFMPVELNTVLNKEPVTMMQETVVNKKKVGRNEPCPCGSGKKYKHCCGR